MKKRLAGINALLKSIGEVSLATDDEFALSYEAQLADKQIDFTLEEVLSTGFKFNTFTTTLYPDSDGYIAVPPDALVMEFEDDDYTEHEGVVFDRVAFTKKFTEPITVTVVYKVDFDYIPVVIQNYIIAEASVVFQRDSINDAGVNTSLEREREKKRVALNVYRIKQAKANGKDIRFSRNTNPSS